MMFALDSHTPTPSCPRWPYLFVTLAPLVLFAPFLLGQQVLYWGTPLLQFYPWRHFALETIRTGHLPLWNPYLGNGAPLIANLQSAVFYPPNWLALILPLDYSLSWLVALHLIWAGAGMVTIARALGLRPFGQAVAGLAFGLSQYLVARAGFFSINAAVAWLPWIIWVAEQVRSPKSEVLGPRSQVSSPESRLKHTLLLSLLLALQFLAGHAQIAWYTVLLLAAWTLWRTLSSAQQRSSAVRRSAFVALAVLFAFALAALQLLPTAELLRESPRASAADYEFVTTYSFSPWRLLTLLAPDLLGNPARGQFYGYGNYWEDAIYIGILPLLLAAGVIARALRHNLAASSHPRVSASSVVSRPSSVLRRPSSVVAFLTLLLVVSILLALGRNAPVFPFFYQFVPTFSLFQAPARMMVWFVFALALLAGIGADRWQAPQGRALYWTRLGAAGAVSMILVGVLATTLFPATGALAEQLRTVARATAYTGLGLFVSAVLSLLNPIAQPPNSTTPPPPHAHLFTRWHLAAALFIAADLVFSSSDINPGAPPDLYREATQSGALLTTALNGHRLFQFPDDEYRVKYEQLFTFRSFGSPDLARGAREAQLPNAALLDGLASANNFDPLVSARYANLLDVVNRTHSNALLRLMDAAWIASSTRLEDDSIPGFGATTFYRVPGEVRRVWIVYKARTVADAASALAGIAAPDFDPGSVVLLEADDPGVISDQPIADSLTGCNPPQATRPEPLWTRLVSRRLQPAASEQVCYNNPTVGHRAAPSSFGTAPYTGCVAGSHSKFPNEAKHVGCGWHGATPFRVGRTRWGATWADRSSVPQEATWIHPLWSVTASPNVVTIAASLDRPGWVVLSDTYYPGWYAYVDGQPARLFHGDYAFRAVPVEAGEHVVEFRYRPRSFEIGLWLSGASWLLWLLAALWPWRSRE